MLTKKRPSDNESPCTNFLDIITITLLLLAFLQDAVRGAQGSSTTVTACAAGLQTSSCLLERRRRRHTPNNHVFFPDQILDGKVPSSNTQYANSTRASQAPRSFLVSPRTKADKHDTVPGFQRSYAPDYAGFAALAVAYTLIALLVQPFHRLFFINDLTISFPHAEVERVPVGMSTFHVSLCTLFNPDLFTLPPSEL